MQKQSLSNCNFGLGPIVNSAIAYAPWQASFSKLPGMRPLGQEKWLIENECYDAQLRLRRMLFEKMPEKIYQILPEAEAAMRELCAMFGAADLPELALSIQEDICILSKTPPFHLLGAFLAFPASWRLEEKIGRPLIDIHQPAEEYTARIAASVARMFMALRVNTPIWRANCLRYDRPDLYAPKSEYTHIRGDQGRWLRSERQVLTRLPISGDIVFTIHSYVLDLEAHADIRAVLDTPTIQT